MIKFCSVYMLSHKICYFCNKTWAKINKRLPKWSWSQSYFCKDVFHQGSQKCKVSFLSYKAKKKKKLQWKLTTFPVWYQALFLSLPEGLNISLGQNRFLERGKSMQKKTEPTGGCQNVNAAHEATKVKHCSSRGSIAAVQDFNFESEFQNRHHVWLNVFHSRAFQCSPWLLKIKKKIKNLPPLTLMCKLCSKTAAVKGTNSLCVLILGFYSNITSKMRFVWQPAVSTVLL